MSAVEDYDIRVYREPDGWRVLCRGAGWVRDGSLATALGGMAELIEEEQARREEHRAESTTPSPPS